MSAASSHARDVNVRKRNRPKGIPGRVNTGTAPQHTASQQPPTWPKPKGADALDMLEHHWKETK